MKLAESAAARRDIRAVVAALAVLSLAGCTPDPIGPDDRPAVANGIDADIASVQLRSFLIISTAEGDPGRFLGTLFNEGEASVEVTFTDDDEDVTVTVPVDGQYSFSEHPVVLDTVGDRPGARVPMTVMVGSVTEDVLPIVLDGSLEQYQPYLPTSPNEADTDR